MRVTVVGDRVFSAAIHSQADEDSTVDWRRGDSVNLRHEVISLPEPVAMRCVELVRRLGLRYGAIDLVEDPEGRFWFLECNPNGQWAWIENRTGLPIAAAIVDQLQALR
ncbi:RimK-like ATP-grasp domain protein [compost metagenome]